MKQRNYKTLLGATVLASVFCLVSIVWIIIQSYYICTNSGEGCIVWHDEIYLMQLAVFIGSVFPKLRIRLRHLGIGLRLCIFKIQTGLNQKRFIFSQ